MPNIFLQTTKQFIIQLRYDEWLIFPEQTCDAQSRFCLARKQRPKKEKNYESYASKIFNYCGRQFLFGSVQFYENICVNFVMYTWNYWRKDEWNEIDRAEHVFSLYKNRMKGGCVPPIQVYSSSSSKSHQWKNILHYGKETKPNSTEKLYAFHFTHTQKNVSINQLLRVFVHLFICHKCIRLY